MSATNAGKQIGFAGYLLEIDSGQLSVKRSSVDTSGTYDHGADPLGDGTFRMVPSGDIVSLEERNIRLLVKR